MGDVKAIVKQYWPYILGGIVGIYLILRYAGGSSSSGSGDGGYAAFLQAQTAAAQQNAQMQLQTNAQNAQLAMAQKQLDAQIASDAAKLEVQKAAVHAEAFNTFQTTQAAMAQAIGSSTAAVIGSLNNPAMIAMQANAAENAAALNAAANVAAASYMSQSNIIKGLSEISGAAFGAIPQIQMPGSGGFYASPDSKWSQGLNLVGRGVAAYYTGGMSEAARGGMGGNQWDGRY